MLTTIVLLFSLATSPTATAAEPADLCSLVSASAPDLVEPTAIEVAQTCAQQRAQARLARGVVEQPDLRLSLPEWSVVPGAVDLDQETIAYAAGLNADDASPFLVDGPDPFEACSADPFEGCR